MASRLAEVHLLTYSFHYFIGRSINVKSAGLIGRHGPQSKQPFMVAFFKASEVLLRSVRAANNKRKNQNRNKSSSHQESSRMPSVGGKMKLQFTSLSKELWAPAQMLWSRNSSTRYSSLAGLSDMVFPLHFYLTPTPALLKHLLLCWPWAWPTFSEIGHLQVSWAPGWWNDQVVWERLYLSLNLVLCTRQPDEIFATWDKKVERRVSPQLLV